MYRKTPLTCLGLFKHHSHEDKPKEEISRYCHNLWHFYLVKLRFTQLKITSLKAADKVQNVSEYSRSTIAKGDSQVQETFSAVRTKQQHTAESPDLFISQLKTYEQR